MIFAKETSHKRIQKWIRAVDFPFVAVLTLAAVLRLTYIGQYKFIVDEATLLYSGLRLGRDGQWTWLSANATAWRVLAGHSPLNVYLAAIPYLFSPDPRLGRLWVALLGIAAVAMMYWVVRRYFNQRAALITGLLLVVHAPLVDWSRFVWNSNYAQPFIAGWVLTGLLGYYEGKRWAQTVHWLALSCAIQAHPGNTLLLPLSLFLIVTGWLRHKPERAASVRATLLGWALFAASLVPWGIGLVTANPSMLTAQVIGQAATDIAQPKYRFDFGKIVEKFANLTGPAGRRLHPDIFVNQTMFVASQGAGNWLPPAWFENVFTAQAGLTFTAMLIMLAKGWRRSPNIPVILVALLGLWPLTAFFVSPVPVAQSYMMTLVFGGLLNLGAVLAYIADRNVWAAWLVSGLLGAIIISQSWLTIATVRDYYLAGNQGRFDAPLDSHLSTIREWNVARDGREMIILAEIPEIKREPFTQLKYWRIFTEGYPARLVLMDPPQGVPIPAGGALVASTYGGETIPALFGEGNTSGVLANGEPMYRWIVVPSVSDVSLILYPARFSLFANGARIVGISAKQDPQPGAGWSVVLIWNVERTDVADNYSFSVRLVDEQGNRFGQVDGLSLDGGLWRVGDTVFNRFTVPVSADYPGGPLRVQLLTYKTDIIPVVDEGGVPVVTEMALVPDEAIADLLGWFEYHPAGRFVALTPHQYFARLGEQIDLLGFSVSQTIAHPGESIRVTLYWKAAQMPTTNFHVFVHLRDANGNLVGQSDKADPGDSPTSHWTTAQYLADDHSLVIAPDTPPGSYQLFVGLWEESTGRATAYNESSTLLGDSVPLGIFVAVQP